MSENSAIEWTTHTFNAWWGCSRVSPACRFCYADASATQWGHELWRRHGERRPMSDGYWRKPLKWNRDAEVAGVPAKVFCASMSDVFEDHPQVGPWRDRLWPLIESTPWLIWQLLTKRIENVAGMVPWTGQWPGNVWIGCSVENQRFADQRLPALVALTGARVRFLSCEPLLGPLVLDPWLPRPYERQQGGYWLYGPDCDVYGNGKQWATGQSIGWIIGGGESGAKARPSRPDWFRSLRDQCVQAGVPFFLKQWGQHAPVTDRPRDGDLWLSPAGRARPWQHGDGHIRRGGGDFLGSDARDVLVRRYRSKHDAGRELNGRTWDQFPKAVAVQAK